MSPVPVSTTVGKPLAEASNLQSGVKTSPSKGQPSNRAKPVPTVIKPVPKTTQQKSVTGRSSKPIINWFQRKLAGTGRAKRAENHRSAAESASFGKGRAAAIPLSPRGAPRVVSSPVPSPVYGGRQNGRPDSNPAAQRKTLSLNGDDDYSADDDDNSLDQSSLARESTWSPGSAQEADDDASVRPLPPSAPPSPSPSRSSSSYLSDPRTFRSIAASTKPTTLLSIDMNGNGMAHIAQAPTTPPTYINRFPHIRNTSSTNNQTLYGSGTSITFSALPQSSSRPSSLSNSGSPGTLQVAPQGAGAVSSVQAPLHTSHHPRNNPRPSSPPLDNASVLTLASSAYAMPGMRTNVGHSATPSARGIGESLSHFGGSITYGDAESTSQFVLGDDDRLEERDVDASVRALRPRSSRRGSWESEASRWSARVQLGTGTPSLARERSLWTTNSVKTGAFSAENAETETETYDRADEGDNMDENEKDRSSQLQPHSPHTSISDPPATAVSSESLTSLVHDSCPSPPTLIHGVNSLEVDRKMSIGTVVQLPKPSTSLLLEEVTGKVVPEVRVSGEDQIVQEKVENLVKSP